MPGAGTVAVPNVVGLTRAAAEQTLTSAGLVVGTVATASSRLVPPGNISAASPAPGTQVNSGSAVDLEVSGGPAQSSGSTQISVPDVTGLTRSAAEAQLKSAGLTVGKVKQVPNHTIPVKGVSDTDPSPGSQVNPGSAIGLEVSTGPEANWTQCLFAALRILLLWVVVHIVSKDGEDFLKTLSNTDVAGGLITFLVAIAIVGITVPASAARAGAS